MRRPSSSITAALPQLNEKVLANEYVLQTTPWLIKPYLGTTNFFSITIGPLVESLGNLDVVTAGSVVVSSGTVVDSGEELPSELPPSVPSGEAVVSSGDVSVSVEVSVEGFISV